MSHFSKNMEQSKLCFFSLINEVDLANILHLKHLFSIKLSGKCWISRGLLATKSHYMRPLLGFVKM